tara:strand:- start:158 stop:961 length:804 start_codon:yes stop_codon:yes gene_type:complete
MLNIYEFLKAIMGASEIDGWYKDMINTNLERRQSGQLLLKDMARPASVKGTFRPTRTKSPDAELLELDISDSEDEISIPPSPPISVDIWGGISKAAQRRMTTEEPTYSSLSDFLLNIKTEQEFDNKITSYDMNKVATFLSQIRNKEISGKEGIIAELGLRTKKAEAEEKERELNFLRQTTRDTVKRRFEKLKQDKGDIAIAQRRPRGWRTLADAYAKEKGLTTDGISLTFRQMMAILYVEEHKDDPAPKRPGLFVNLRQPAEPRLRF